VALNLPLVPQSLDYTCGAACFESMFRYFRGASPGEMVFAQELGTMELGYTDPGRIVALANRYGFSAFMREGAGIEDLRIELRQGAVIFVTWWDEDAGHYSLVDDLTEKSIRLMDPWIAGEGVPNDLELGKFVELWRMRGSRWIRVVQSRSGSEQESGKCS
jgi:hypothetical protein